MFGGGGVWHSVIVSLKICCCCCCCCFFLGGGGVWHSVIVSLKIALTISEGHINLHVSPENMCAATS